MTEDGIAVLQLIFDVIWRFFNSWHIPGTNTTPGMFLIFLAFAGIVLRFLGRVTMTSDADGDIPLDGKQASYRGNFFKFRRK